MTGRIASKLTTNSQCTHWVSVPLPPVSAWRVPCFPCRSLAFVPFHVVPCRSLSFLLASGAWLGCRPVSCEGGSVGDVGPTRRRLSRLMVRFQARVARCAVRWSLGMVPRILGWGRLGFRLRVTAPLPRLSVGISDLVVVADQGPPHAPSSFKKYPSI